MKAKTIAIVTVLLASVALLAGYTKLGHSHLGVVSSGGVWFALGEGWRPDRNPSSFGLYPARYVSQSGVVRVILLPPELGGLEPAVAGLRETFEADPAAVKGSFVQEPFVTERALSGIHVCYHRQVPHNGGVRETECHHYLVRNRSARYVVINYQAGVYGDPSVVDHRIRDTLRLQ